MAAVTATSRRPSRAFGQFRVGRRLIDKDQPRQGLVEEAPAPADPQFTRLRDLRTLMFACPQAFFYGSAQADGEDGRRWSGAR